jgi:hypothetical protein
MGMSQKTISYYYLLLLFWVFFPKLGLGFLTAQEDHDLVVYLGLNPLSFVPPIKKKKKAKKI